MGRGKIMGKTGFYSSRLFRVWLSLIIVVGSIIILVAAYFYILNLNNKPFVMYTFTCYQTDSPDGSYINIVLEDMGSANEIKNLSVISSGTTGEDSVPPSANVVLKKDTPYRFKFNNSSKYVEVRATIDGALMPVLIYDNESIPKKEGVKHFG